MIFQAFKEHLNKLQVTDPHRIKQNLPYTKATLLIWRRSTSIPLAKEKAGNLISLFLKMLPFTIQFVNHSQRYYKAITFVKNRKRTMEFEFRNKLQDVENEFDKQVFLRK